MESRFATWMDRHHLERPAVFAPDEADDAVKIVLDLGLKHEAAYVERLRREGRDIADITQAGADRDTGLAATLEAMHAGREIVYQAQLREGDFGGVADFLVRIDGTSALGGHHYEPWDTKLARHVKPYFLVQLCCYADMLEAMQERRPARVAVILGTGEHFPYRTDDYFYYYRALRRRYLEFLARFDAAVQPEPEPGADHGRWSSRAADYIVHHDLLQRVAGITRSQIAKLKAAGVATAAGFAGTGLPRVPGIQDVTFRRLRTQARLQRDSEGRDRPLVEFATPDPDQPLRGLALLPPPSEGDVYFDIEGYPHVEGGLEYLLGVSHLRDGTLDFSDWWAHDADEERRALEGFVDWVHARWRADPRMHIYHYAAYEVSALRRLMGRHGTREEEVDELLRNEVFVDLCTVVRQAFRIGTPSYSLKDVERLYRDKREGGVATAGDSIVQYHRWRESGEPGDWRQSPILKGIRDYNRDDCESLVHLATWLREQQRSHGIKYLPRLAATEERPAPEAFEELRKVAQALMDRAEREGGDAERATIDRILGSLVEFHRREKKPAYWARFDRRDRSDEELVDDPDCLGDLRRTETPRSRFKQSWLYEYAFDPDQDTKLEAGDSCAIAEDLFEPVHIHELDRERGRAVLKVSQKSLDKRGGDLPARLSLIPGRPLDTKALEASILELARAWLERKTLPDRLRDLLLARLPRIRGHSGGALRREGEEALAAMRRLVPAMEGTTLCIQGPPGSGKTYTAARVILDLLKDGRTAGVTSNSHKAILNLLGGCVEAAGAAVPCMKVGGPSDDPFFEKNPKALHVEDGTKGCARLGEFRLMGGTAWFFARPELRDRLDYLFVDEAGQVSLANLVAMAPAARNLVLIGDQMQLAQPTQGSHPGRSGCSSLEYVLADHATIPPEMGLLLDVTHRLHPALCRFISESVYEGRLRADPACERRVVRNLAEIGLPEVGAGLVFVAVEHEGNTQASDEEVAEVVRLFERLHGHEYTDKDGKIAGTLQPEHVLFVAPYNMQVRKLARALPAKCSVGSVDRFQGQQAPVVVLSMCSSDGGGGPRGLEFLFSRNRLNVALSRAFSLAIVVGHPGLANTPCTTVPRMELVNLYCRILEEATQVP